LNALEGDDTVQVSTDILDRTREDARQQATEAADQLARASTQLSQLATELAQAHRDRMELQQKVQALETRLAEVAAAAVSSDSLAAAEARLAEAVARAETAESAWSGLNARLEQTHRLLDERTRDVDQLTLGRKDTENALATSRKLMREYAAEAGRKAEELREADQRLRALETEVGTLCARADDAQREADFQRSLVAMLEVEVAQFKTSPPPPPVDPLADERAARLSGRVAGARDEVLRLRTFLDIAQGSLEALIERVASDFETATASLHAVTLALVEEEGVVPPAPPEDAGDEAPEEPPPPPESV
jgi:chromosome segregation ATPase